MNNTKNSIAAFLYRAGLSANFVSFAGLGLAFLSGLLIVQAHFRLAAAVLILSGLLDMLDGAIARASGDADKFGGILDSSLDRYGDGFVFGGVVFYCARTGLWLYAALALSALLGAFLVSYVRARVECVMENCRVGFWERGERIVYLALGLFLHHLAAALWVLGLLTHGTALARLWQSFRLTRPVPAPAFRPMNRRSWLYFVKAALFLAIIFFWH